MSESGATRDNPAATVPVRHHEWEQTHASCATTDLLLAHWETPADTQDEVTDALARAGRTFRAALFPAGHVVQVRWDSVMVDAATKAIARHPGSRVLVLVSHRNRFMFVEALRRRSGVKLMDMHGWLLAHGFGAD